MLSRFRWVLGLALIPGWAGLAAAEEPKVHAEMVTFAGGSGPIKGYLARPEGDGPFPAIVLVHEWWGLSDWVKQNANRFAAQGYVALAVDLYGGKATDDPQVAHELMRALDQSEAVNDLKGGVAYLQAQPFVAKGKKLGVIGWCMGGGYARELAEASEAIGPTAICYGSITTEPQALARLKDKPILGIFGADDRGIPAAKVEQFGQLLKKQGTMAHVWIYPHAGHAFMRPGGPQYSEKAALEAWEKIDQFFQQHLKQG